MLVHHEVVMKADYEKTRYIPFDGMATGSVRNFHSVRLGHEGTVEHAKEWAIKIFPEAEIVEVWETNILGDRIKQVG